MPQFPSQVHSSRGTVVGEREGLEGKVAPLLLYMIFVTSSST
jgi:hypothetical protein